MALSFFLAGWMGAEETAEQLFYRYQDSSNVTYLQKLFAMHGSDLYHFLLQQSDRTLAEDISQQVWLTLLEQPGSFRGASSFKTWLFSIGRNGLIDELRRLKRWQPEALLDDMSTDGHCPEQQLSRAKQQLQLGKQLQLLPFLQREALMLQLEGFSIAQISDITQQPDETIKSRLRYARQFLQQLAGVSDDNA
ncbi:sigma-70 family RNA polymerase sigma factor [Rheinheimera baltica]|uniref:Sigma-70 family RNA polymerase sigma factor n=1 Tax=Rheinheimera baltica TaxID=67576 RepID=A0ABT9HUW2_9GAMM|nr:sigma-70 family RNA polymerase sigma factor [Rheinheimera baltica]MDP5134914.1 sigma-70 family RNA polymerase sigma factor [Rheinheimera baltica]